MKRESLIVRVGGILFMVVVLKFGGVNTSKVSASSCAGEVHTPVRNVVGSVLERKPVRKLVSVLIPSKNAAKSCSGVPSASCSGKKEAKVGCSGN